MANRGTTELNMLADAVNGHGSTDASQDIDAASLGITKRARWTHQMKLFLIQLLTEHDVPGYRTHNAWSKDAWTNIVCRLNKKFNTTFSLVQVKQQEQDLKKAYRSVKDLLAESGFGWDSARMMVHAPPSVWASFAARKNSKDALHWQDRSFPYFDALAPLYVGRHAEGRSCHGMDHYASKAKNAPARSTQAAAHVVNTYQSPSPPPINNSTPSQSGLQFPFDEELDEANLDFSQHSSTPLQHTPALSTPVQHTPALSTPLQHTRTLSTPVQHAPALSTPVQHTPVPPSSTQISAANSESRRGKRQKNRSASPDDGFHERYLKLKSITVLEGLNGLQMGDILKAADIFKIKENREVFLSFSSDALRLAWITQEIGRG